MADPTKRWAGYGKSGGGEASPGGRYAGDDDGTRSWPAPRQQMSDDWEKEEDSIALLELALERIAEAGGKRPGRQVVGLELEEDGTPTANMPWGADTWPLGASEHPRERARFGRAGWANPPEGFQGPPLDERFVTNKFGQFPLEEQVKEHDMKAARNLALQKIIGMLVPRRDSEAGLKAALEPIAGE
jgi:hypothetical protein